MAGFALGVFEPRAEAFAQARARREHQFLSGQRPGRGLNALYDDFPEFTSTDLWADLQAATPEDERQHKRLSALLAAANLEGRTREQAIQVTRVHADATLRFEDQDLAWRRAPVRWRLLGDVPRRHEMEDAWRSVVRAELTPVLERWHEVLRAQLVPLGAENWLEFWSNLCGIEPGAVSRLAQAVLDQTAEVYGNSLGVYLGQFELPIDDVRTSDIDWAFRALRFDVQFSEINRVPLLIRVLRDLGVEFREQTALHLQYDFQYEGMACLPLEVPRDVRVLLALVGGWQDFAHTLAGAGMAEHLVHADPSLRFWERGLGDESATIGYGWLLEGLVRDRTWLASRMDYAASDDFRIIAHLAWLYRVRGAAATALYEQRAWQTEPGSALAGDYEESLSTATRVRHFADTYLQVLMDAPWSTLRPATQLRAEVFAAQLRQFLRREFDEEWWRSSRAARFLADELWRPARRHSAEELLGFMGYEGFDVSILTSEVLEVLQPL